MRKITENDLKDNASLVCMTLDGEEMCTLEYMEEDGNVLVLPVETDEFVTMSVEKALEYANGNSDIQNYGFWWAYPFDSEEAFPLN